MKRKIICIVGGGPAGLMAADILSRNHEVLLFDKEKNIGQKFLVAGKGGFNLTNSLLGKELCSKYTPAGFLDNALMEFDTLAFRQWLSELGISTFVGTSGRVFPEKNISPNQVLNKIKTRLLAQGVKFFTQYRFISVDPHQRITFRHKEQEIIFDTDFIVFALGGASWPQTGSDGSWINVFQAMEIIVNPFQASNCGINIHWPESLKQSHAGKPLKNIRLFTDNHEVKGEAMITQYGLEGNAVYQLVPAIREMINAKKSARIFIDFKPFNTEHQLLEKVKDQEILTKDYGRIFSLTTAQLAVIKTFTTKEEYLSVPTFIQCLKKLKIPVASLRPVGEAISTIGGVSVRELNEDFSLKKYPWIYTIGEMVDWDAPTGGFLIQGSVSMANYAAQSILKR
ncbi:MAG: aminoacetone oxidase family FAD-binding enzyme [Bacteroidetes bacterium HGW-Bacteroidetes-21]|jgi:hypothetical protein|nr:MAG: aminoacetone oxidase family FAD-binding enzyme [Bacteroidetes bacterium HGW-Bacteroidetes-21]